MADIRNENSKYVIFVLQYEDQSALILKNPPEGWDEDDLKIVRNTKYHGITTQFTNGLKFISDEKDYIEDAYSRGGLNANLYLIKFTLRKNAKYKTPLGYDDLIDDIAWEERYRGLADFKTRSIKDNKIEVNFNSDELEQILKSYEGDEFELNRKYSLDSDNFYDPDQEGNLSVFSQQRTTLPGRKIVGLGEAINADNSGSGRMFSNILGTDYYFAIPTEFVSKGFDRHVEVSIFNSDLDDSLTRQGLFCYNDSENIYVKNDVDFYLEINGFTILNGQYYKNLNYEGYFVLQQYIFNGAGYDRVDNVDGTFGVNLNQDGFDLVNPINFSGQIFTQNINNKTAFSIEFRLRREGGGDQGDGNISWSCVNGGFNLKIIETGLFEESNLPHDFSHVNDIGSRLMEIMTGKTHKFYSKFLGRDKSGHPPPSTGVPSMYQDYDYVETGEGGELGVIHGFSIRRFKETDDLYKPITTSFKDYFKMLKSHHNLGLGIENSKYGQRVRVEKLEYFYREETAVVLPMQAVNVTRKTDPNMFFSGTTFGSDKGGDYEFGLGLDEPNVKTSYSLPLKKTSKKYEQINKYRSDDTGLEITRRKTFSLDPTEDTSGDEHIWLLDLKGANVLENYIYDQLHWSDVLAEQPSGIANPDSYRSWRFTPKRSLLRHGWVLRSGMEQYVNMNKRISLSSTNANINLSTRYIGEDLPVAEKEPIFVKQLDRARVLPEIIKFTYPLDNDVMDMILGTTTVEVGGENEDVPNFYFKLKFINENGEAESGYIKSVSPNNNTIELFKANERIIFSGTDERTADVEDNINSQGLVTADSTTITADSNIITADNG
mgnify:CR=1 FL=1